MSKLDALNAIFEGDAEEEKSGQSKTDQLNSIFDDDNTGTSAEESPSDNVEAYLAPGEFGTGEGPESGGLLKGMLQSAGVGTKNFMQGMTAVENQIRKDRSKEPTELHGKLAEMRQRARQAQASDPKRAAAAEKRQEAVKDLDPVGSGLPDKVDYKPKNIIEEALVALPRYGASMLVSAANIPAGTAMTFMQMLGEKDQDLKEKGMKDADRRFVASFIHAALGTPVEMLGNLLQINVLKGLAKGAGRKLRLPKKLQAYVGGLLKGAAGEGGEETVQAYTELAADVYAANPGASVSELTDKFWEIVKTDKFKEQVGHGASVGAVAGALLPGAGIAVSSPFDAYSYMTERQERKLKKKGWTDEMIKAKKANPLQDEKTIEEHFLGDKTSEKQEETAQEAPTEETTETGEDLDAVFDEDTADTKPVSDESIEVTDDGAAVEAGIDQETLETQKAKEQETDRVKEAAKQRQREINQAKILEQQTEKQKAAEAIQKQQQEALQAQAQARQAFNQRFMTDLDNPDSAMRITKAVGEKLSMSQESEKSRMGKTMLDLRKEIMLGRKKPEKLEELRFEMNDVAERNPNDQHLQALVGRLNDMTNQRLEKIQEEEAAEVAQKERTEAVKKASGMDRPKSVQDKQVSAKIGAEVRKNQETKKRQRKFLEQDTRSKEFKRGGKFVSTEGTAKGRTKKSSDIASVKPKLLGRSYSSAESAKRQIRKRPEAERKLYDIKTRGDRATIIQAGKVKETRVGQPAAPKATPVKSTDTTAYQRKSELEELTGLKFKREKQQETADQTEQHRKVIEFDLNKAKVKMKNAPEVEVITAPKEVPSDAKAHFDPKTNKAVVYSDRVNDAYEAREALWHEAGHYSLKTLLGKKNIQDTIDQVKKFRPDLVEDYQEAYGYDIDTAAEEALIELHEQGVKASVVDKVRSKIRRFARHLGYKKNELSDAEIRDLLSRIRKNALKGKATKANKYDAAPIKYKRKRKEGQHQTALGNILWMDIPTILEQAGSAKEVEAFLKNKKRWKGRKLTPEGIKYAVNQAKRLEKNPEELKYRKELATARQKIRLGTVKEGTKKWDEIHKKFGADLRGYSIPHYQRYYVTKGKVFGPKLASDTVTKVEKVHALTGPFTVEEVRDKKGNLVIPTEILPQNPTKRKEAIDRLVQKNKEFAGWYENWNQFMRTVGGNLSQNEIFKYKKIQAILSAQTGPQGNMQYFKQVIDLLESGKDIQPGKKADGKSGIDKPTLKKVYDVWHGRETSTDLETLKEIYGDKVGAYMTAAIDPQNPGAVVIDRHMPRLWGYDITWHPDGAWGRKTVKGGHPKFTIAPEVEQEIVADIKAAAERNNMTSAGVQAALWYESRIPDVQASSYREAARLRPSEYLPDVLYKETLAKDLGKAVHYRNTVLEEGDFLLATPKPEGTEQATYSSYSRQDIQARIDQHTEKNPYAEMVYFYEAGTKPEPRVKSSKKQVYNVDLDKYNIYDLINDPLNMNKTINQRLRQDPMAHPANVMANVVENAGYDGFVVNKAGGRWVVMHKKAMIDHAPVQANVGISDVVESKENLPQDIEKLAKISPERSRKFQQRIKEVAKNYPEVELIRMQPAIAQFEGATSGQMEVSTAVSVRGPLPALRAYLSELGAEHAQRNVFLMHTNFNQVQSNGRFHQFKAKSEFKTPQDLKKVLEDKGLEEFNIVTDQQTGSLWIEQFVFQEDPALDKFMDVLDTIADPYFPRNEAFDVHSEVLGDADFTGDFDNALEGYRKNLTEYFGNAKGEQRYAEALQRREKFLAEFPEEAVQEPGRGNRIHEEEVRTEDRRTTEELGEGNLQEVKEVLKANEPFYLSDNSSQVKYKRTNTQAFRNWFGDSKVVDENGDPKVVYHGSAADFSAFKDKGQIFFSPEADVAEAYGRLSGRIYPVYLKLENPYIIDFAHKSYGQVAKQLSYEIGKAKREGHDGLIIENLRDARMFDSVLNPGERVIGSDTTYGQTQYVVFKPTQVKSAVGNRGTFDPDNPDIRFKRTKIRNSKDLVKRWRDVGVNNNIKETNGTVDLLMLEVPEKQQGTGLGTQFMNEFLQYTDHKKKRATLLTSGLESNATAKQAERLVDWYKRFGFEIVSAEENGKGYWMQREVPGRKPVANSDLKFKRKKLSDIAETTKDRQIAEHLELKKKDVAGEAVSVIKKRSLDSLITQVADELHPLKVLQQEIEKKTGKEIETSLDAYKTMRMLSNFPAIFGNFLHNGELVYDGETHWVASGGKETGILSIVKALGENTDLFFNRLKAKSAQEMLDKHPERFTDKRSIFGEEFADQDVIESVLRTTEKDYQENKQLWDWAEEHLQNINKSVLDLMERSGTISAESRKEWERDVYVPFSRVLENEGEFEQMFPNTNRDDVQAVFHMKGSKLRSGDPLANLVNTYEFVLNEALKNLSRKKALKLMKEYGVARKVNNFPGNKQKLIGIRHKGKSIWYDVEDKMLMDVLTEMDNSSGGKVSKFFNAVLQKPKHWLTYSVTFSPGFRVANLFRDTLHTSLMQKSFVPVVDSARGFYHAWTNSPWMKEYAASGGSFVGSYARRDVAFGHRQKDIERVKSKMTEKSTKNFFKKIFDTWERIGEASENAARLGLYMNLRKEGKTSFESGFEAKDLLDFHMKGKSEIMRWLIKSVPFLNARIQGLYKLGRTAKSAKTKKNFLIRGAVMAALSSLLYAANSDDDRFNDLQDWEKAGYWHFWIGDHHIRLPVPFEVGSMFGVMPTSVLEYFNGERTGGELVGMVGHVLNETFRLDLWPQALKPLVQQGFNKDFYTDIPIVGNYEKRFEGPYQYGTGTSLTARMLGKLAHKVGLHNIKEGVDSPKRIDALIQDYGAYIGMLTVSAMDLGISWITNAPSDPAAMDKVKYLTGVSRFYRGKDSVPKHTKYEEKFYDLWAEVDGTYATLKELRKMRNKSAYQRYRKANWDKLKSHSHLSAVQNRVRALNRKMDIIHFQKGLSRKQKKKRIDDLLEKRHKLVKRSMKGMAK